jgi:prepilin peptidase CpaA
LLTLAHLAIAIAALTLIVLAALQDVRERLISNRLSLLLLGMGVPHHMVTAASIADWLAIAAGALAVAAIVLLVGFALWRLGSLGGGDVKLLVAAAFFVGPDGIVVLLAGTALVGGALALAYLLGPAIPPVLTARFTGPDAPASGGHRRSLPYGVAIAAGLACAVVPSLPILIG